MDEPAHEQPAVADADGVLEPPRGFRDTLRYLGPGLILAGSIVGSGELIATTRSGAEAGYALLWLIILGCVFKVFAQVEICRHCITHRETTLTALDEIPKVGRAISVFWMITFLFGLGQLGGIVGGVGQALDLALPIPESILGGRGDFVWAVVVTLATILLLTVGGFSLIETVCVALVGTFTLVTVGNVIALQTHGEWAIHWSDLREGLSFGLPEAVGDSAPLITALAAFGIIGVGASELVAYPYWCLEKGYGRFIGVRDESDGWLRRARGWIRVLQVDAWGSMVVYTLSTVAFYLLGAAVLHRLSEVPEGLDMIKTLSSMYRPVFGKAGEMILLLGAVSVLFSTFFVSNANKSRLMTDTLDVFGLVKLKGNDPLRQRWIKFFSVFFPLLCLSIYWWIPKPALLVLLSGLMQSLLLPLVAFAALWFRYKRSDPRLRPGRLWDIMLMLSFLGFVVIGFYIAWEKGPAVWTMLTGG